MLNMLWYTSHNPMTPLISMMAMMVMMMMTPKTMMNLLKLMDEMRYDAIACAASNDGEVHSLVPLDPMLQLDHQGHRATALSLLVDSSTCSQRRGGTYLALFSRHSSIVSSF